MEAGNYTSKSQKGGKQMSQIEKCDCTKDDNINEHLRITWIDIARGYGILCVIIGHLGVSYLTEEVYTFHVPLFFFLSGCVFSSSKYNFKGFLKRKIVTLIIPYVALGVPMILFTFLLMYLYNVRAIIAYIVVVVQFIIQRRMWTLWFITCLFCLNIIFYILVKSFNNDYKKIGVVTVGLTIIGLIYYKDGGLPMIWNIDVCLTAIPFFYVGYLFKNIQHFQDTILKKERKVVCFILLLFVNLTCKIATRKISGSGLEMFRDSYGFAPLTYLSAFAGIFCVIIVSYSAQIKPIRYIGKNSLVYYAWHQTIMIPIIAELYKALNIFQSKSLSSALELLRLGISLLIICTVLSAADYIIRNTKLKFMVGLKETHDCLERGHDTPI